MNKRTDLIYLASPYSHAIPEIQIERAQLVAQVAADLVDEGYLIYCPIAHGHYISTESGMSNSWLKWSAICKTMLKRCDRLWIVTLSGWEHSIGIKAEHRLAKRNNIPISFLDPDTLELSDERPETIAA